MKLHLGCGKHILDGWVNVDLVRHPKASRSPDLISDVSKIALEDGCADELLAVHILEHLGKYEGIAALKEWTRLLQSGGKLVIECPDIIKCAKNLLANTTDQLSMWGIYGNHEEKSVYMQHRYGWTYMTLKPVLESVGYAQIVEHKPQWHGKRKNRDFRIEAIKV